MFSMYTLHLHTCTFTDLCYVIDTASLTKEANRRKSQKCEKHKMTFLSKIRK